MLSAVENRPDSVRIRVRQGEKCVDLVPGTPALSSAGLPWDGVLLECHAHGPHSADTHQHLSHFVCLHRSEPAPVAWQAHGRRGNKVVEPGSIFLVSRGNEDSVYFPKPVRRILVNLEPSLLRRAVPDSPAGRDVEFVDQWGVQDSQVDYILRALEADLEAGNPAGRLFGESLICALAAHLQSRYAVKPSGIRKLRHGLPRIRLNRVIEFIDANLDRPIALADLAETAGISSHYFSELFKRSVQLSPHQYVLRRRIDRARKLLGDPGVSVFEAAVRCGFNDQSHFTKIFHRIVGVTPTGYRAAL
jgi:AraC family transcriptional regulator